MLKRESYRNAHSPFGTIAPLLDNEFDDVMNETWMRNIAQPTYRNGMSTCVMADILS